MVRGDTKRTIRTTPLKGWYGGTVDGWYAERGVEMTDRERILQHVWRAKDYADLGEREFNRVMDEITSLEELEAVANRRKHLRAPQLKKWSQWQRDAILRRQWELRHG